MVVEEEEEEVVVVEEEEGAGGQSLRIGGRRRWVGQKARTAQRLTKIAMLSSGAIGWPCTLMPSHRLTSRLSWPLSTARTTTTTCQPRRAAAATFGSWMERSVTRSSGSSSSSSSFYGRYHRARKRRLAFGRSLPRVHRPNGRSRSHPT